jgi:hypothetical protein
VLRRDICSDWLTALLERAASWQGFVRCQTHRHGLEEQTGSKETPMTSDARRHAQWPALPYVRWRDTAITFHLWTQVIGKIRLALTPWLNHGWNVALCVNSRGVGTSPMHLPDGRLLEVDFDLMDHALIVRASDRRDCAFALEPMTVADFYDRVMSQLEEAGVGVAINVAPCEVPSPIPFPADDVHGSYDAAAVHDFWLALVQADRVFRIFRSGFLGKSSPVHLFWGALDLAVTRFSGRDAPLHPGGIPGLPDAVTREAYSHEVSSAGFWPGNDAYPHAAFYSYAYPTPVGFDKARIEPDEATWSAAMGEWLLPYEAVRAVSDPDGLLLRFLATTYRAAADLGRWDRELECAYGATGRPRAVPPR